MRECRKCGEYHNHCWCERDKLRAELEAANAGLSANKAVCVALQAEIRGYKDACDKGGKRIAELERWFRGFATPEASMSAMLDRIAFYKRMRAEAEQRIADAPHHHECDRHYCGGYYPERDCTCWKKA